MQEVGDKPMRAAVLSVAQQQKLASCTALLKEAAMVYGFALHIDPEVGEAASDAGGGVATEPKEGYTLVQPLRVKLNVASKGDKAALEEAAKVSYALPKHEAELKSAARAPTVDIRANRLAGTAFGAIGLPGASQPPLAIRKLQRAKAGQKDRSGIFAASDAAPAESSHREESAAYTDAEAAEDDEISGQEASDSMLEGAAGSSLLKERSHKRPLSAPTQNGNRPLSSSRKDPSSEDEQHELGPSRLPKPRAARAGSAQSLPIGLPSRQPSKMRMDEGDEADEEQQDEDSPEPELARSRLPKPQAAQVSVARVVPNGQPCKRLSRMRMDEESEADVQQEHASSPEPARKRLRSSVHQKGNAWADVSAAENGAAQRYLPDEDLSHEPDDVDAVLEEAQRQHSKLPVRDSLHADAAKANGQAGGLRSRLASAATQGLSGAERVANGGLRSEQGKHGAMKRDSKGSRGLFGAALTGLQR